MPHIRFIILIIISLLTHFTFQAQDKERYERLSRITNRMTLKEVKGFADKLASEGHTDSAIAAYTVAINRFDRSMSVDDKVDCIKAHLNASGAWIGKGATLNALQLLLGAREISESIKADSLTMQIINNMAYVYLTFKNYEKASALFAKALELNNDNGNQDASFRILNNLASVNILLGNTDKAMDALNRLRRLTPASPAVKRVMPFHILLLEGAVCNSRGFYEKGAAKIKEAIACTRGMPEHLMLECQALEDLCKSYKGMGLNDSLLVTLQRFKYLSDICDIPDMRIDARKQLWKFYESISDQDSAIHYRHDYLALADSVMNYREFARLSGMEFVYETNKYKNEISQLTIESDRKTTSIRRQAGIIASLLAGVLTIGILLFFVIRQRNSLRQSYHHLFRLHEENLASESSLREQHILAEQRIAELEKNISDEPQAQEQEKEKKYSCSPLKGESVHSLGEKLKQLLDDPEVFCNPELNVNMLAELAGSNTRYVSQAVNETFGTNFPALLNKLRITEAKRRLADPAHCRNFTIAAISQSLGYKNQTTFIAAFKKDVGMTPSIYMRIAKEERKEKDI